MERRKFLIGAGALGAGASAALGTGAFTTVEAQRNVDIATAGDANAQLAIQAVSGANAELVNTEADGTLSLSIPNVNEDAVTDVEDLFRVVNQGTQPVSLYFQDDSDAVTFRVTRSAQSLEGADNSVELGVGEQVVVGLTIDTLNNDISGTLLDSVTIVADASASAPGQSGPQPQYVVTPDPSGDNEFGSVQAAIDEASGQATIGVEGGQTLEPESTIQVDVDGVTLTGFNGIPTLDGTTELPSTDTAKELIEVSADGVTISNLNINADADTGPNHQQGILATGNAVTLDSIDIDSPSDQNGNPLIELEGRDPLVTSCQVEHGPISVGKSAAGEITITNNLVDGAIDEGIWGYGQTGDGETKDFVLRNNEVKNHDTNKTGKAEIKIVGSPDEVNGQTGKEAQLDAILSDNSVKTAEVGGDIDTVGGDGITANFLGADYSPEGSSGGFSPISIDKSLNTNLIADSGGGFDELEIHGSAGGNNVSVGESLSGGETSFSVTLDPGANTVTIEAAGETVTDPDVTDGETADGSDADESEFDDGIPSEVDIAVNLISRDDKVAVEDLTISGSDGEVSGYKMASSGPLKVFEFVGVPADGTVTVEGTLFVGSGGGSADSLGVDFADPADVTNRDQLISGGDPR